MSAFVYLNPSAINYEYNFLACVCNYITSNSSDVLTYLNYKPTNNNEYFVENFNKANSMLMHLYNDRQPENVKQDQYMLDEQSQPNSL